MRSGGAGRINHQPTPMQVKGVDNVLSGRFPNSTKALRAAGYGKHVKVGNEFFKAQGVELYLKTLSKVAKKRWNYSLPDKVALVYLDGLSAEKPYGKNAELFPDHAVRLQFANRFAQFFGWTQGEGIGSTKLQQFNFFSVDENTRHDFNENFKLFLRQL